MRTVYLNIGSNKGDRRANIEQAVALITSHPLFAGGRLRRAPLFHSRPEGYASDAEFINLGLALDFDDNSFPQNISDILKATQSIEKEIAPDSPHRNADGSYRDRVVDIDIIDIEGVVCDSPELTIPHPRALSRRFVTVPMRFLAPEWPFRGSVTSFQGHNKKSIAEMNRDSVEAFKTKKKLPLVVILDNIRSQNNIGSIFRTSDAFCVEKICLCGITATPPAEAIHKTALGAEESVDWAYFKETADAVKCMKEQGFTVVCLEQVHNSLSLDEFQPDNTKKYAVVVGNEVTGVDQKIVDMCDICVEIPQSGTKHSLNVAVSAAVAMWHIYKDFLTL